MLTEMRLAEKRKAKHIKRMAKRLWIMKMRETISDLQAKRKENRASWLAEMGKKHEEGQNALNEAQRQAQISRRTGVQAPQGVLGRLKSFLRRSP